MRALAPAPVAGIAQGAGETWADSAAWGGREARLGTREKLDARRERTETWRAERRRAERRRADRLAALKDWARVERRQKRGADSNWANLGAGKLDEGE